MSEGFEKLKAIGAQKIYETTHIAKSHVESILKENFEKMSSVQFTGFISILEREYSIDLSELKSKGREYFNTKTKKVKEVEPVKLFGSFKKKRNLTTLYIALGVAIFILFSLFNTISNEKELSEVDNSAIESAKNSLLVVQSDENSSKIDENSTSYESDIRDENSTTDENSSVVVVNESSAAVLQDSTADKMQEKKSETQSEAPHFKIIPNQKVWLGYIDLSTYKKYQKTFSDELVLDFDKEWLLLFGHGQIDVEINGERKKFTTPNNLRLLYKNSELKEIDSQEFQSLNRGNKW